MTHFSSARLSSGHSSLDAASSAKRTSSCHSMGCKSSTRMVTRERWLCAPYSEISFEQGHRLFTGTATSAHSAVAPARVSAIQRPW